MDVEMMSLSREDDFHVVWQASQSQCQVFNNLLATPEGEESASENQGWSTGGDSRGWQLGRQESFDQIPGFSRLSTEDSNPLASSSSTNLDHMRNSTSSLPSFSDAASNSRNSRAALGRTRLSHSHSDLSTRNTSSRSSTGSASSPSAPEANSSIPHFGASTSTSKSSSRSRSNSSRRTQSTDNPLQAAFCNKSNPNDLLNILKGVSAKVDQSVGVSKAGVVGSGSSTGSNSRKAPKSLKRPRAMSVRSRHEAGLRGSAKRGKIDTSMEVEMDRKGKRRAVDGRTRTDSSFSNLSSPINGPPDSSSSPAPGFSDSFTSMDMDVDVEMPPPTPSRPRQFLRTPSQDIMPPPPGFPIRHGSASNSESPSVRRRFKASGQASPSSGMAGALSSTKLMVTPAHTLTQSRKETNMLDSGSISPVATSTPKLHPLLQQKAVSNAQARLSKSTSTQSIIDLTTEASPSPPPTCTSNPLPTSSMSTTPHAHMRTSEAHTTSNFKFRASSTATTVKSDTAAPTATQPNLSSKPRAPVLGMRRAHTHPTSSSSTSLVNANASSNGPSKVTSNSGSLPSKMKAFRPPLMQHQRNSGGTKPGGVGDPGSNAKVKEERETGAQKRLKSQDKQLQTSLPATVSKPPPQPPTSSGGSTSNSTPSGSGSATSIFDSPPASVDVDMNAVSGKDKSAAMIPQPSSGDGDDSFGDISFELDKDLLEAALREYD